MPVEMRTLIFSRDELSEAISEHERLNGSIMFCSIASSPEFSVTLKLVPEEEPKIRSLTLDAEAVGAALIQYCLLRNIPLPRRSERRIQAMGEAVAMNFSMNQTSVRLPEFA